MSANTDNPIKSEMDLILIDEYRVISSKGQEKANELFLKGATIPEIIEFCKDYTKKEYAEKLQREANLVKRFKMCTFERFNPYTQEFKTAYNKAKKYVDLLPEIIEDGTNIVFEGHGCVGTGKTHIGYSIINAALNSGIPAKAYNSMEFTNAVSYSSLDKKTKQIMLDIPLLMLDDLSKICGYDWLLLELYAVLNYRYEHCKPTILTIEETISELRKQYIINGKDRGKSIFSRICENVVIVDMRGDDYRLKRFEMEG